MKYSKLDARSRLLKARQVSLKNHLYPLFDSEPSFTMGLGRSTLLVLGYRQTGVTTTLYDIALSLVRETPQPASKKRHLLLIRSYASADCVWQGLYGSLITGIPFNSKFGPRVSEASLKAWLKGYGFDMIVEGAYSSVMIDEAKYEVIHEIADLDSGFSLFRTRGHLGMKCLGVNAPARLNSLISSYPLGGLWLTSAIILQTVPPQPSDNPTRIKVRVEKYRTEHADSFIGKEFVITTIPAATNIEDD